MNTFDSLRTREARALQIWQILIGLAHNRQTITYKQLSKLLRFEGAGVFSPLLEPIMMYCKKNNLPPLTILVVNEATGMPGEGLATIRDLNEDREKVFRHDWYGIHPPSEEELREAIES